MKREILSVVFVALAVTAAASATAQVSVQVGVAPFVYGGYPPPPVVYQPYPYYAAPPVVYLGGGAWAGDRWGRGRGHRGYGRHP
jgi:hypothetical protein